MASGIAKRLTSKKKIAFGDGKKIIWTKESEIIFLNNPRVAKPGDSLYDVLWEPYYRGNRNYFSSVANGRFIWNYGFQCEPGEFYFTEAEEEFGRSNAGGVVVEPHTAKFGNSHNRQWPIDRMQTVVSNINNVIQFDYGKKILEGVTPIKCTFREAAAVLKYSKAIISMHGGLQIAAAAVGLKGIIILGNFIPPNISTYHIHDNLIGYGPYCGTIDTDCDHCKESLDYISNTKVLERFSLLNV